MNNDQISKLNSLLTVLNPRDYFFHDDVEELLSNPETNKDVIDIMWADFFLSSTEDHIKLASIFKNAGFHGMIYLTQVSQIRTVFITNRTESQHAHSEDTYHF